MNYWNVINANDGNSHFIERLTIKGNIPAVVETAFKGKAPYVGSIGNDLDISIVESVTLQLHRLKRALNQSVKFNLKTYFGLGLDPSVIKDSDS